MPDAGLIALVIFGTISVVGIAALIRLQVRAFRLRSAARDRGETPVTRYGWRIAVVIIGLALVIWGIAFRH